MSYSTVSALFSAICDAIRARTGGTGAIDHQDIPTAIDTLPAGGVDPDDIAHASVTGDLTLDSTTDIKQYAFYYNGYGMTIDPLNITSDTVQTVNQMAFRNCSNLITVELNECTTLGTAGMAHYCFAQSGLVTARFPKLVTTTNYAFYYCMHLEDIYLPKLATAGDYTFQGASALKKIHLPAVKSLGSYIFDACSALKVIALNHGTSATAAVTIKNNSFRGTPLASGTGYVLVPRDLISTYETATNWATLAAAGTQFLAIEDCTVDGTTTGDLDESKIAPLLQ